MRSVLPAARTELHLIDDVSLRSPRQQFAKLRRRLRATIAGGLVRCIAPVLVSLLLGASGCVGSTAHRPALAAADSVGQRATTKNDVVCEMEKPTGSNIPVRVCRNVRDGELQREQTKDALRKLRGADSWDKE